MAEPVPVTKLSAFSSPNAMPTVWSQARDELADAEVHWLSTVCVLTTGQSTLDGLDLVIE
jgi:hypothetical protein